MSEAHLKLSLKMYRSCIIQVMRIVSKVLSYSWRFFFKFGLRTWTKLKATNARNDYKLPLPYLGYKDCNKLFANGIVMALSILAITVYTGWLRRNKSVMFNFITTWVYPYLWHTRKFACVGFCSISIQLKYFRLYHQYPLTLWF